MKNQSVYNDCALTGWPCHFFTEAAKVKYNARVARYCRALPDNSTDLTRTQRLRLWFWSHILDAYDILMHLKQSGNHQA